MVNFWYCALRNASDSTNGRSRFRKIAFTWPPPVDFNIHLGTAWSKNVFSMVFQRFGAVARRCTAVPVCKCIFKLKTDILAVASIMETPEGRIHCQWFPYALL